MLPLQTIVSHFAALVTGRDYAESSALEAVHLPFRLEAPLAHSWAAAETAEARQGYQRRRSWEGNVCVLDERTYARRDAKGDQEALEGWREDISVIVASVAQV